MFVNRIFRRLKREQSSVAEPEVINSDKSLTIFQPGQLSISMKDVGGYKEAKVELMEIVHFFKQLEMYQQLGAQIPKGALFYGRHGVGKSLLVKAAAGECNVPFLVYSCGEFLIGDNGPERLRSVFEIAHSFSPCILFLDELQSISVPRDSRCQKESLLRRSILEELLIQLDGFEQYADKPIIVLAAARTLCEVDHALQRPGRFDRLIEISMPDEESRKEVLEIHLRPIKTGLDKSALAARYAGLTDGLSCADLANLCNEGAIAAGRVLADSVDIAHFDAALGRLRFGVRKLRPFTDRLKKIAAYHNAGHAVVDYFLFDGHFVKNINIFPDPKGQFSCCTRSLKCIDASDKEYRTICLLLAGLAAEEVVFGQYSACGKEDIETSTWIALSCVVQNGFTEFGKIFIHYWYQNTFYHMLEHYSTAGEGTYVRAMGVTKKIIESAYGKTKRIVKECAALHKLAEALMDRNSLSSDDIAALLGSDKSLSTVADECDNEILRHLGTKVRL